METHRMGSRGVVALIMDSNILLYIAEGLIPLSSFMDILGVSYVMIVPDKVLSELSSIASSTQSYRAKLAKRALEIAGESARIESTLSTRADDAIVELAVRLKNTARVVVATADKELRARLREVGVPTIYYRESKGGLEIEWEPLL